MTPRRRTLALLVLAGALTALAGWRFGEVRAAWVDYAARIEAAEAWGSRP